MPIKVELFTSLECRRCAQAKDVLREIVGDVGANRIRWRTVNVIEEVDYAVSLGVLSTPAIAIDGELLFTSLPSAKKLRQVLEQRLNKAGT
jgi:protein-disulfide isomerase